MTTVTERRQRFLRVAALMRQTGCYPSREQSLKGIWQPVGPDAWFVVGPPAVWYLRKLYTGETGNVTVDDVTYVGWYAPRTQELMASVWEAVDVDQ